LKEFLEGIDKDISRCDNILKENNYLEIVIGVEELVDKYKDTINNIAMNNDRVWNYSKKDLEIIKEKLISYKKEHIGELVFKSIKANLKENKEISVHKLKEIEEALNKIESIYYENTDIYEKWIKLRVYIEWVSKEEIYVATNILRAINIVLNINE
jgi:hypothetical protein